MKTGVTLQSILSNVSTRKDGSFKLVFETQELNANDGAQLLSLRNKIGWLLFSADEISPDDIPEQQIDPDEYCGKSPSQRLRSVLFVYWKQKGSNGTFNQFYNSQIEKWIDQIKERLE